MFDDRIEILLFILLQTAYWTAFNLPDVEFIVIGRSLTRIPVRYKLIDRDRKKPVPFVYIKDQGKKVL